MFYFVVFAAALSLTAYATDHQKEESCPAGKRHYRTTVRHIESGGIGYENGYTTLETFLSSDPSQIAPSVFVDARGHIFDNGKWAANIGAGLRTLWERRVFGINTYFDYRNTSRLNAVQIGAGLETLGEQFDFRINGYWPIGAKTSAPYDAAFGTFSGNYMLVLQKYQSAMKGADAEFGFHFGKTEYFDFYAAAGPYYFIGEKAPATWGGKARVAGIFLDTLTMEISDSYDPTFQNKFQGQISLGFSFGPRSKVKKESELPCKLANTLNDRMLQPVGRQEIIAIDNVTRDSVGIDPVTGLPYFFVFVNNTSNSDGTYESPYHSLAQAQERSSPNDIIYVFPGDGTTTGMDSGIALKANQMFWGSGISHSIQTSAGTISIPAQSSSDPIITNTNVDTEGNVITLASNNAISGFTIASARNDAIFGADSLSLDVSFCTITNTTTYAIEASFLGNASISLTNNRFLNNVNGVILHLAGTSTVVCSGNTFEEQTSMSSIPFEIAAVSNVFIAQIENNIFNNNTTSSVRIDLTDVANATISGLNNTFTNNAGGALGGQLGSNFVIYPTGTNNQCTITLNGNTFTGNEASAFYTYSMGTLTTLEITASTNTMSNNGGSAFVLAAPVDHLTFFATDNFIAECNDHGIAVISAGTTSTGNITINNNTIKDIHNGSSGMAINQDFSNLNLTIENNEINGCEGTGIISFAPNEMSSLILNVSGNAVSNCQNLFSNAASGLDIEQYLTLFGSVTNNTFTDNASTVVTIGSALVTPPTTCLTLSGNDNSLDYLLTNTAGGTFSLSPCNVDLLNTGMITSAGPIDLVQSCPDALPCPP